MSFHRRLSVPASVAGLSLAVVERALIKHHANVRAAAKELNVPSGDLRKLTWCHPRLVELALEEVQQLVDRAEERIREALHGADPDRALSAATFILSHSRAARERGWCRHGGGSDHLYSPPVANAPVMVIWQGDAAGYRPLSPAAPEACAASAGSSSLSVDSLEDNRVH